MIKNYLKTAWRSLQKNKGYSLLNIAGLAAGMAVVLLIGLWIKDEVSFDRSYQHHDRLAQVMVNQEDQGIMYTGDVVAMPMGEALSKYPDFKRLSLTSGNGHHVLKSGNKKLPATGRWVQKDFAEMFSLKMIKGKRNALQDPSSLLLSVSVAKALFGDDEPIGSMLSVDDKLSLKVAGVYEDLPHNSTFYETNILLPWGHEENNLNKQTDWANHCGNLFVELNEGIDLNNAGHKIKSIPTPFITGWKEEAMLHPVNKLHLYNDFVNGKAAGGRIQFVWLFAITGSFVLLLACINFMNLSTARSEKRAMEVGIRKALGSMRSQLVGQFLGESIIVALLSLVLGIFLTQASLPFFNELSGKQMSIAWSNPLFWLMAFGFALITGVIAGSYPAFYLSAFQPIKVLKGTLRQGRFSSMPRKLLVVLQFTVSVTLVIGTLIVFKQIQFAKQRPVGYTRNGLITVPLRTALEGHYTALRTDLLQTGVVENMAASSQSATSFNNNNSIEWRGKDPGHPLFFRDVNVTHDFGKTINWQITSGRDFSKDFAADSAAAILSETAASLTGLKNPIGETIRYNGKAYTIVGVVKDMVTQSPYDPVEPSVFFGSGWMSVFTIRVKPTVSVTEALAKIAPVFRNDPGNPFTYRFIDDEYARKFSAEVRIGNIAAFFTILAIFISCLGLLGLASFIAEQRNKEIGIRKVLGASVFNLWRMLSKEFVVLVTIASFIAIPLAWYCLSSWLQAYDYRTRISWWIFGVAGGGAILITVLTISFHAVKAALANPVNSLRNE